MLAAYATYLRAGHVEDLVEAYLRATERLQPTFFKQKSSQRRAERLAELTRWWDTLLSALEASATSRVRHADCWLASEHPLLARQGLESPADVLRLIAAEKQALMRPLASYSTDVHTVLALVEALEAHYQQITERMLSVMARLHDEARGQLEQTHRQRAFGVLLTHELRTPLNCILGFATLLRTPALSAEQTEFVGEIDANARRMLQLVDDLLDVSRAEAGKLAIAPVATDYAALVHAVLASLQPLAAEKGLHLDADVHLDGPVRLDPLRIRQVLTNLLHNAIKFTPAGGRVHVLVTRDGSQLVTEVHDTGRGFTALERDTLFGMFSQLDGTPAGGSGLGLAITRALVRAHGGRIEATSAGLEQGACFRFVLPL